MKEKIMGSRNFKKFQMENNPNRDSFFNSNNFLSGNVLNFIHFCPGDLTTDLMPGAGAERNISAYRAALAEQSPMLPNRDLYIFLENYRDLYSCHDNNRGPIYGNRRLYRARISIQRYKQNQQNSIEINSISDNRQCDQLLLSLQLLSIQCSLYQVVFAPGGCYA